MVLTEGMNMLHIVLDVVVALRAWTSSLGEECVWGPMQVGYNGYCGP